MIYKALAVALMRPLFKSAQGEVLEAAKKELLTVAKKRAAIQLLEHVARKYSEEVEHNVSRYIEAIGKSSVTVEFKGKPGEALISRAEAAIDGLDKFIARQNPDGTIIQYLKKRYSEEGIRVITGRLIGGHYVNRTGSDSFQIMNRMGYAAAVDKSRPWMSSPKTAEGIAEIISAEAERIFAAAFENIDLSAEVLKFSGGELGNTTAGAKTTSAKTDLPPGWRYDSTGRIRDANGRFASKPKSAKTDRIRDANGRFASKPKKK